MPRFQSFHLKYKIQNSAKDSDKMVDVHVQAHNMTDDKQTDIPHIHVQHTFVRMCLLW